MHVLPCAYEGQRTISHISPCLKPCLTKDLLLMTEHTGVASPQISRNYLVLVCNLTERTLGYRCMLWYPACVSSKNQNQILSHWPRNHSVKGRKGGEKLVWKEFSKPCCQGSHKESRNAGKTDAILRHQPKLQYLHIHLQQWFSTFLVLWPSNTVLCVMTQNHKIIVFATS